MKKRKYAIIPAVLLLAAFLTGSACTYITGESPAVPPMKNIVNNVTPEQAYQLTLYSSFRIQIIDVRTPLEYQAGHITGAINIDYNAPDFKTKIDKLDKTAVYLVYCHSGNRSAAASKVMAENGFKYINNATKGFTDLVAAGFTTEH